MYQIVKIFNVSPEELVRLHKVLEGDVAKTDKKVGIDSGDVISQDKLTCAELLSAKLEETRKTYRVEIKMWIKMPCLDPRFHAGHPKSGVPIILFPSRKILLAIYDALDPCKISNIAGFYF